MCVCLCEPADHSVCACFFLCLGLYLSGFVALRLPVSERVVCTWVGECMAVSSRISILALPPGSHLTPMPVAVHRRAPKQEGLGARPEGAHSSSPAASNPTRPGLSPGSAAVQPSRVVRLSFSVEELSGIRVELPSSPVKLSRADVP